MSHNSTTHLHKENDIKLLKIFKKKKKITILTSKKLLRAIKTAHIMETYELNFKGQKKKLRRKKSEEEEGDKVNPGIKEICLKRIGRNRVGKVCKVEKVSYHILSRKLVGKRSNF